MVSLRDVTFPSTAVSYTAPDPCAQQAECGSKGHSSSPYLLSLTAREATLSLSLLSCRNTNSQAVQLQGDPGARLVSPSRRELLTCTLLHSTYIHSTYSVVVSVFVMPASFAIAKKMPCF